VPVPAAGRAGGGLAAYDPDQVQGHELARVGAAGPGIDPDAADQHGPRLQTQAGLHEFGAGRHRRVGARRPAPGLGVAGQPEALVALGADEQDLHQVALVGEDLVDPARIAGPGQVGSVRVPGLAQDQPRLGQLGQQADHLVAAGQVLVEVAEVGPQVLQIGLLVEQRRAIQHQGQIDQDGQDQRRQAEDQQEQKDQVAQFHDRAAGMGRRDTLAPGGENGNGVGQLCPRLPAGGSGFSRDGENRSAGVPGPLRWTAPHLSTPPSPASHRRRYSGPHSQRSAALP